MSRDARLADVDLLGIDGQKQFGIDVIARLLDGSGREAASCKCYAKVTAAQIREWSNDFLKYRDEKWADVRRFVLVTAATNITSTDILDQRAAETARFSQLAITYEVWGPEQLTDRIGTAERALAQRFLGAAWADTFFPQQGADASAALLGQAVRLQHLLSDQWDLRIEDARDRLRCGDDGAVVALVSEIKRPNVWPQLVAATQARALRLEASAAIHSGAIDVAGRVAAEARALSPDEPRVEASLASLAGGPKAGLEILSAPTTRAGRQARWALLLEAEDLAAAAELASAVAAEDDRDAETLRLLAYQRLFEGRRAEALAFADAAAEVAPNWLGVMRVGAIARYAQAISPLAPPEVTIQPNPSDPSFVRNDADSLEGLRQARATFDRLATRPRPERGDMVWRLACLANLPEGQAQAVEAAAAMLAENPADPVAIAWAIGREMPLDLAPSRAALEAAYREGQADAFGVRAIAHLLLRSEGAAAAQGVLTAHLDRQVGDAASEALDWIGRLGEVSDDSAGPGWMAVSDGGVELARRLADEFDGSEPGPGALMLSQAAAQANRFDLVAPYADRLERFDTEAAINVVLYARFHSDQPEAVLDLMARQRDRFRVWATAPSVRRVEIRALAELHRLPEALRLAELLAAQTNAAGDRLLLANLHISSGHAQAALPAIRDALEAGVLDPVGAIRFSFAATREDRELAQRLWRYADAKGLPDDLLVLALGHAHRLGLEEEAGRLMPRIHARAKGGASDVWLVETGDIVETLLDQRERNTNISELYELGVLPIHLAAVALNLRLAEFYWLAGRAAARTALRPLLIRNGGRPLDLKPDAPWKEWTLHLDLTGLLIADQLDLLPQIERLPRAVVVSPSLPHALYTLEQEAAHHQLARVEAARAISKAHLSRRLFVQSSPASETELVRHERLRRESSEPGPSVDTITRMLVALGEAASFLPQPPDPEDVGVAPSLGARLVLADNTLEALALRGLLEPVLSRFRCEIPQADLDDIHQEILRADAGETVADWIGSLRLRVGRLIENGRFVFCPEHLRPGGGEEEEGQDVEQRSRGPLEQGLIDLITAPTAENGVLWCDDRNLSGYVQANGNLIMGVTEVMNALVADGHMTGDEQRQKLLTLRAGGAAFLPMRLEELLVPLRAAPLDSGRLVETRDLAALRRNLAAASVLDPRLKMGAPQHPQLRDRPDEIPFLANGRQLMQAAVKSLWLDPGLSIEECMARADWVWAQMRLEQPLRDMVQTRRESLATLLVAGLYSGAAYLDLKGTSKGREARRKSLADWITARAVDARSAAGDEAFLNGVAKLIAQMAAAGDDQAFASQRPPEEVRAVLATLRRRQYALLPEALQQRLLANRTFAAAAGLGVRQLLTVAGTAYPAENFWRACGRALRTGTARVRTADGVAVALRRDSEGALLLEGGASGRLQNDVFRVLEAEGAERARAIHDHLHALDLSSSDFQEIGQKASKARTDATLARLLESARERSVLAHYEELEAELREQRGTTLGDFLPPSANRLRHYLRLMEGETTAEHVRRAWTELRTRFSARTAFLRLSALPVDLARIIGPDLREHALELEALGSPTTPLMRLHRAAIARALADDTTAQADVSAVVSSVADDGLLLPALLAWTELAFHAQPEWRELPTSQQLALAWGHAHRIAAPLLGMGFEPRTLAKYVRDHPPDRDLASIVYLPSALRADVAAPTGPDGAVLAFHGLAYVAGGEDVSILFPDMAEALADLLHQTPERKLPRFGLLLRSDQASNVLGTFLADRPRGLPPTPDLDQERAIRLGAALAALDDDPANPDAWKWISIAGAPRLTEDARHRLDDVFERLSFADVMARSSDNTLCPQIVLARRTLGGPLDDKVLNQKLHDLAAHCAFSHSIGFGVKESSPASVAFGQVIETAAAASRGTDPTAAIERLGFLCRLIGQAWPASASALRTVLDAYVSETPHAQARPIWEALVELRRWP